MQKENRQKISALIIAYNGLGNSGVPKIIYESILAMHDFCDIDVAVFNDDDFYYKKITELGCRIIKIPNNKNEKGILKRIKWRLFKKDSFIFDFFKDNIFKQKKYDIVHSFKEYDSWPIFEAAMQANIPIRILHCNVIQKPPVNLFQYILYQKGKKRSILASTALVAVSTKCAKYAFGKKKCNILYNPYDDEKYRQKNTKIHEKQSLNLLHISNFSKNKNQMFSVKILDSLVKNNLNTHLFFIGDGGDKQYKNKVISYIKKKDLSNFISFLSTSDFNNIIDKIDYYILPSKAEGASLVTVESQALGKRIFASSSISKDMDAGGVIFVKISRGAKYWAKKIIDFHKTDYSIKSYNLSRFSRIEFKRKMKDLYNIIN